MADYTRIYSDDDCLSHFEDLDFEYDELAGAQFTIGTQEDQGGGLYQDL